MKTSKWPTEEWFRVTEVALSRYNIMFLNDYLYIRQGMARVATLAGIARSYSTRSRRTDNVRKPLAARGRSLQSVARGSNVVSDRR